MASAGRRLALITGASSGIGLEVARQLAVAGHDVVLACRDESKAQAAVAKLRAAVQQHQWQQESQRGPATLDYVLMDLASMDSVRRGAQGFLDKFQSPDVLLCNAGIAASQYRRTADGHESMLQTNHLGHFLLVHLLMPALLRSDAARVVVVSSDLHRRLGTVPAQADYLSKLQPSDPFPYMQLYGLSKLYNLWFTFQLAKRLPPSVVCNAVTPGFVPSTSLSRDVSWAGRLAMQTVVPLLPFAVSLQEGGRRVSDVCVGEVAGAVTGKYFAKGQQAESSAESRNEQEAERLWQLSLKAAGLVMYAV